MKSLQGEFLVASPHLPDPNFFRTVVLLIQHADDGAFGVVLNRPGKRTVTEIWEAVGESDINCDLPVYLGGPVEGPLLALHRHAAFSQNQVMPGLYIATGKDQLKRIVRDKREFRVFCGYAGWGPGQLDSEIEIGGWLTSSGCSEDVFLPAEEMWKQISGRIGLEILAPTIGRQPVPEQPWLN
jgi:putative transcriptional regulator